MPKPKTSLLLFPILFVLVAAAIFSTPAAAALQPRSTEFELYPEDSKIGRTDLIHDETATARPIVRKQGKHIFQVFISKRSGRELFRVDVGTTEATFWVYGLIREADFNGDGIPDFSWHGGDDTSQLNLAVLSSPSGYRKVDLEATLRREWRCRFPSDPAEKSLLEDPVYSDMKLMRKAGRLLLQGIIRFSDTSGDRNKDYEHLLRVKEQNFVYVK